VQQRRAEVANACWASDAIDEETGL